MKIAHFSDLHFSHFVLSPFQFFSKTWIGNANLLLKRGRRLQPLEANYVKEILEEIQPDVCIFSGDFTTTAQPQEFQKAQHFITQLKSLGIPLLKIPGNHDHYTKKSYKKKIFYSYLSNDHTKKLISSTLKVDGFEIYDEQDAYIVLLDQTKATPWFTAYGVMQKNICDKITNILSQRVVGKPVIIVGHFPLIAPSNGSFHHALKNSGCLQSLLCQHRPSVYLHGHNHNLTVFKQGDFIQIDSGSLSDVQKGSFIVLDTQTMDVTPYYRQGNSFKKGSILS